MINNVVLVGRLTKDSDLRYTSNGTAVATFTLAVNRSFTSPNGQRNADFINCVIWRKPAESFAKYTQKGTLVGLTGRIQTRSYDNAQGQRVYVTEVVLDNFQLLESRRQAEQRESNDSSTSSREFRQKPINDLTGSLDRPIDQDRNSLPFDEDLPF